MAAWIVTRSWPGTVILASALVTHIVLALDKLSDRATLRLPTWELLQLVLVSLFRFCCCPTSSTRGALAISSA